MRTSATTTTRKYVQVQSEWEMESPTWLDSKAFRIYTAAIEDIVHTFDVPVCTRDIHHALGENANRDWTADALGSLISIGSIEPVGLLPTRYAPVFGAKPKIHIPKGQQLRWLFQKRK